MKTLTKKEKEGFMKEAVKLAIKANNRGEVPVGAVIVKDGLIVGRGFNQTRTTDDPTAHAEIIAIKEASQSLKGSTWKLNECSLYVTLEPCSMCAGAIVLSRIKNLYIGAEDAKTGACGSVYNIVGDGKLNHVVNVEIHILGSTCSKLIKDFFCELRKK
ncbi:MAG: nucleoside deaminase [Clostridiales bacterium]|jgi:tRNA(adenine34) deaminase|nr:nucleoside deaminase [Clostridiales bacterium]